MKDIKVEIHSLGHKCRVTVDGEDLLYVKSFTISRDASSVTRIDLETIKSDGEPITFKGRLLEDEA